MTDTTQADITEAPKPKRKYTRRANVRGQKPKPVVAKTEPDEFAGITNNSCCASCSADKCVITGKPYCGHPYMGGLRHGDMNNPGMIEQMKKAKSILAHASLDKRLAG